MPGIYSAGPSGTLVNLGVGVDGNVPGGPIRALYVGGAGNVFVRDMEGVEVTFSNVPAGTLLPIACQRVYATGTTATLMIGLR